MSNVIDLRPPPPIDPAAPLLSHIQVRPEVLGGFTLTITLPGREPVELAPDARELRALVGMVEAAIEVGAWLEAIAVAGAAGVDGG